MTVDLHYRKTGEGQPLIILHGLFGSSDNWQTIGKKLAEKYTVFLVDLRNHGHSPHTEEFSYRLMADDLHQLVVKENLSSIILVGHSMGGKTALYYAQQYPEKLEKLVVVDMGIKKYPPHHQLIFDAIYSLDLDRIKTRKEAEEILKQKITDFSVLQFLLKNLYWTDKEQLAWRMNVKILDEKMEEILAPAGTETIPIQTLFIRGEKSNYILDADWGGIKTLCPSAELATIPGTGHWVHAESPQLFYKTLEDFLG